MSMCSSRIVDQDYDVGNDVMKSTILEISNDDNRLTGPINLLIACCKQRVNQI